MLKKIPIKILILERIGLKKEPFSETCKHVTCEHVTCEHVTCEHVTCEHVTCEKKNRLVRHVKKRTV